MTSRGFDLNGFFAMLKIKNVLIREALGEFFGTFIYVLIGTTVMIQKNWSARIVTNNNQVTANLVGGNSLDLMLIAGWGFAALLALLVSGQTGYGLYNPAMTLVMALLGRYRWITVPLFMVAQYLGALLGSMSAFYIYHDNVVALTSYNMLEPATLEALGRMFYTYPMGNASLITAFFDQTVSTLVLTVCLLAVIDARNFNVPVWQHPLYTGLITAAMFAAFYSNAGCPLNPARDFSPRFMLMMTTWSTQSFTADGYFFWCPWVATHFGALVGLFVYQVVAGSQLDDLEEFEETDGIEEKLFHDNHNRLAAADPSLWHSARRGIALRPRRRLEFKRGEGNELCSSETNRRV